MITFCRLARGQKTPGLLQWSLPMQRLPYGKLPDGRTVEVCTLTGADGALVRILTYGATVAVWHAPDREGRLVDVVLGFDSLKDYLRPHPYFGAIAGRVAGRIRGGRFSLDGQTYQLAVNDPPNHLHGGIEGFHRKVWAASPVARPDGADSVRLCYRSPDGEEGYPGTVEAAVNYTLTADNTLIVETTATTDRATPFSLTQHSYFNLAGAGTVEDHEVQILADHYAPADEAMGLLGRREPVGLGNDFRRSRRLGEALPDLHNHHGDLYFLPETKTREPRPAARVYEPRSGRILTVSTTEACLQLYTGVGLDGSLTGKSGQPYGPYAGLCLEGEGYPDGVNTPGLGDIILRPDRPLRHASRYAFSTDKTP